MSDFPSRNVERPAGATSILKGFGLIGTGIRELLANRHPAEAIIRRILRSNFGGHHVHTIQINIVTKTRWNGEIDSVTARASVPSYSAAVCTGKDTTQMGALLDLEGKLKARFGHDNLTTAV